MADRICDKRSLAPVRMLGRWALGVLAVLAALAVMPALAAAAPVVQVKPLQGGPNTVDLRQLRGEEDVRSVGYAVRSQSSSETETITGFSLEHILEQGGVDLFTFSYVEVVRPGGGSVLLTRAQVREDGAFPDGQPVVFEDGSNAGFLRPSSGSGDYNSDDFFAAAPLSVIAHKGPLIEIEASASATKAKVGEKITFTATIKRQAAGSSPDVSWSFSDGSASKSGFKVTHSFDKPGLWHVAVGATTADDRTGGSDLVKIRVGKPKKGGPDREGGGEDDGKGASDKGSSNGDGGTENGTGDADSTGTSTTPSVSPSGNEPAVPESVVQQAKREQSREKQQPRSEPGETVAGELLDGDLEGAEVIEVAPPKLEEEEKAPMETLRSGTPSDQSGFGISGAALAGIGAVGLVGLGALMELGVLAGAAAAVRRRLDGIRGMMKR